MLSTKLIDYCIDETIDNCIDEISKIIKREENKLNRKKKKLYVLTATYIVLSILPYTLRGLLEVMGLLLLPKSTLINIYLTILPIHILVTIHILFHNKMKLEVDNHKKVVEQYECSRKLLKRIKNQLKNIVKTSSDKGALTYIQNFISYNINCYCIEIIDLGSPEVLKYKNNRLREAYERLLRDLKRLRRYP